MHGKRKFIKNTGEPFLVHVAGLDGRNLCIAPLYTNSGGDWYLERALDHS
jgi:hypothetical protein